MASAWLRLALLALPLAALPMGSRVHAQAAAAATAAEPEDDEQGPQAATVSAKTRKPRDPADAQKTLDAAAKSLEAGKAKQAIQQINVLLSGPKLDVRIMARAMVIRGSAWRKQGKPAQAIADLTSALWLKGGLSEADRTAALATRTEAYREAGLADAGPAPDPKGSATKRAESTAVASTSQRQEAQPAPAIERRPSPAAIRRASSYTSQPPPLGSRTRYSPTTGPASSMRSAVVRASRRPSGTSAPPTLRK